MGGVTARFHRLVCDSETQAHLDSGQIGFGYVGDDPEMGMVGDPIEFVAGFHLLPIDHPFFDHVSGRWRWPIERQRHLARAHFADMALGNSEIAKQLLGPARAEIDLRADDFGAVLVWFSERSFTANRGLS